jgi:hypothetical protein
MQFLKKHYEKIILSAVLLALAAAAFWFYGAVGEAKNQMTGGINPTPPQKPWKELDLSAERATLAALNHPPALELSGPHNLFNPVTWKMKNDGSLFKVLAEGAAALVISNITPLYYTISYDQKGAEGYYLTVEMASGKKTKSYSKVDEKDKTKPYVIVGTKDAADGSSALQLEITDTGETVSVTTNQPYKRVDSYEADLKYPPETRTFIRQHLNDRIILSEDPYKIIAITNNAVTVQNTRTTKKTTIEWIGGH